MPTVTLPAESDEQPDDNQTVTLRGEGDGRDDLPDRSPDELAEEILDELHHDHRFCSTCFRKLREVEHPGMRANGKMPPDCAIGFAYPTEHTEKGLAQQRQAADPVNGDFTIETTENTIERRICKCGSCHHRTVRNVFTKQQAMDRSRNLSTAIDELREEFFCGSEAQVVKARLWGYSRDALLYATEKLKSDPDRQFKDDDLLQTALEVAIRFDSFEM